VSRSTGSALSEEATLGFIDEFAPLSRLPTCSLVTPEDERDWIRTQGSDLVPVDIILIERPTPRSSTLPCPMPARAMSIPTERTQYPTLRSLHAHLRSTFTLIITGTNPNRAPHTSQLSLAPPNDRVNLTHPGFTLLSYPRYFHLRWLRDYHSAFFSPLSHSRSLSSSPSLHNHRSYHSLSASMMSTSTASTSIAPTITPARANKLRTLLPPAARTQAILYLGQNGRKGIGGIAYVARRVVMRWEREEARASGPIVGNGSTVHLADAMAGRKWAFLPGRRYS